MDMKQSWIDMHCDTLLHTLGDDGSILYDGNGMQSIRQMKDAGQLAQFFAVFFPPRKDERFFRDPKAPQGALLSDEEFYQSLKNQLLQGVRKHKDVIAMAKNAAEILENEKQGRMSAVLTIEDGRLVNGEMKRLKKLREDGVTAIALTWNYPNCFGYPNSPDPEKRKLGLTDFGKEAVVCMQELGILVDVSHLSDGGFYDVAELSKRPFIASHSNCRALSPHLRNLTDEMIRILAEKGGVSGLNFAPEFLTADLHNHSSRAEDLAAHVLHMLNAGGEDVIALGTDFDGIRGEFEIGHPQEMEQLFALLKKKGITERQMDKFVRGNVLRVLEELNE
ncbi:MAG: membrane dipeptidase [Eubacteriales bacterium]|nr:membrane dipeptidase [Eubacteriales bacterium]